MNNAGLVCQMIDLSRTKYNLAYTSYIVVEERVKLAMFSFRCANPSVVNNLGKASLEVAGIL